MIFMTSEGMRMFSADSCDRSQSEPWWNN